MNGRWNGNSDRRWTGKWVNEHRDGNANGHRFELRDAWADIGMERLADRRMTDGKVEERQDRILAYREMD